jgi:hypothetical protein
VAAEPAVGFVDRTVRVARTLLSLHLEVAHKEATADVDRLVSAAVLIVGGGLFFTAALFVAHVVAVVVLVDSTGMSRLASLGVLAAGDVALGALLVLAGKRRMKGPVLKETRALMKRTARDFSAA